MVVSLILIVSTLTLIAELWLGFVVIALHGEKPYIDRAKEPVQYWLAISFHMLIGFGLPLLAYAAGI